MTNKPNIPLSSEELRYRAEDLWRKKPEHPAEVEDAQRMLHELQVHQIELEMQNDELQDSRNEMEVLLEKYTDLYDFAPTGYFALNEQGCILEVNLTGASLLGIDRSLLISQCLARFVTPKFRPAFLSFLQQVFSQPERLSCEATLLKKGGEAFWAAFHGTSVISSRDPQKWCWMSISDITAIKQVEETKHHLEMMAKVNHSLQEEVIQRRAAEEDLRQSEQQTRRLLEQSRHMQEQLRLLSRRMLTVQEEERKRISRELHDEITQTLISINVSLETLSREVTIDPVELRKKITRTQRLVEKSVNIAHRFAQELRPAVLDDLGLIPALHAFMKNFMKETGVRVTLNAFSDVENLTNEKRTVLYRVAQESLTHVGRHAHASRAEVSIQKLPDEVHLQIKDNGKSFDAEQMMHPGKNSRLGLLGMRERIEMVGGTLIIESSPGSGTTIHAKIPSTPDTEERITHDC